jgi:hypothetical protein
LDTFLSVSCGPTVSKSLSVLLTTSLNMVAATRSDDVNALEHILLDILLESMPSAIGSTSSPFRACFAKAGVLNASDSVSLEPDDYALVLFSIEPEGTEDLSLSMIQVKKIVDLFSWYHQIVSPAITRWFELDIDIFSAWRTQPPSLQVASSTASSSSSSSSSSAISDFRKSVKRSVGDYNVFKEDRLWHSWHRHLLTTARSHNVDNVLNLSYKPSSQSEVALLNEQQRFVFSVLEQKVLTSDGMVFIRVHSASGNATAVYSDLVERYSKSTAAQLSASEIEEDLCTFRLDDD